MRARTEGTFAGGRGSWLASGRRGYLDVLFKLLRETNPPDPSYSDVFGKVQYQLGHGHVATIEGLVASDRLSLEDGGFIRSNYGNRYLWGMLRTPITARAFATTMVSFSNLSWNRDGVDEQRLLSQPFERVRIADRRTLNVSSLKQHLTVDISDRVSLFGGLEMRGEMAAYAYSRVEKERAMVSRAVVVLDSTNVSATLHPHGTRASGYVSLRLRPTSPVTTELGVRADRHTWTDQLTVAPRANVAWNIGARTILRGAWGHYYQAHALQDLSVVDGDTAFVRAETGRTSRARCGVRRGARMDDAPGGIRTTHHIAARQICQRGRHARRVPGKRAGSGAFRPDKRPGARRGTARALRRRWPYSWWCRARALTR